MVTTSYSKNKEEQSTCEYLMKNGTPPSSNQNQPDEHIQRRKQRNIGNWKYSRNSFDRVISSKVLATSLLVAVTFPASEATTTPLTFF